MRIHVGEPVRKDLWVVKVHGYRGDFGARHGEEAYAGPSLAMAMRVHLEALALCRACPYGPGAHHSGYAKHLQAAGASSEPGSLFSWAAKGWKYDETGWDEDPAIEEAAMERIDEAGRSLPVDVELEGPERELLKNVPVFEENRLGEAAGALMALMEAWELARSTPEAAPDATSRRPGL